MAALSDAGAVGFRPVEQPERPPFDFLADLLLIAALVPAAPIQAAFPGVPVLSVKGRAPLLAWFSRIHESCYQDPNGTVHCTRKEGEGTYAELTVLLLLRNGRLFGPRIEASSALTQRLAHAYYGMPKALVSASFGKHDPQLVARTEGGSLEARRLGARAPLTAVARGVLPRWNWRAQFPSGGSVRAQLPWVERAECVRLLQARITPQLPWLPAPVEPFGLGLLLEGARMRLLPPDQRGAPAA